MDPPIETNGVITAFKIFAFKIFDEIVNVYIHDKEDMPNSNRDESMGHYYSSTKQLYLEKYASPFRAFHYNVKDADLNAMIFEQTHEYVYVSFAKSKLFEDYYTFCLPKFIDDENNELNCRSFIDITYFNVQEDGFNVRFVKSTNFFGQYKKLVEKSNAGDNIDDEICIVKKVFINKIIQNITKVSLKDQNKNENVSKDIISFSETPIVKFSEMPWINHKSEEIKINIADWRKDVDQNKNSEYELDSMLEFGDEFGNESQIVCHYYSGSDNMRIVETCKDHKFVCNVYPMKCRVLHMKNQDNPIFFINNHGSIIFSMVGTKIVSELPVDNTQGRDFDVIKVEAVRNKYDEKDEDEDKFIVLFNVLKTREYSLNELIKSYHMKKNAIDCRGQWCTKAQHKTTEFAEIFVWPFLDMESEIDKNAEQENLYNEKQSFNSDVTGHCYPKNGIINLKTKREQMSGHRYISSQIQGTYFVNGKNACIIAIVDTEVVDDHLKNIEKNENNQNAQTIQNNDISNVINFFTKSLIVFDDMECVKEITDKIVANLVETLARLESNDQQIIKLIKDAKLCEKIVNHKGIIDAIANYKFLQKNDAMKSLYLLREAWGHFYNSSNEIKICEKICSDVISDLKIGKNLYVMPHRQFETYQTLTIPIKNFYDNIKFTDDRVVITYDDKNIITHLYIDLINEPIKRYLNLHLVTTIPLNEPVYLDTPCNSSKRTIFMVWKDVEISKFHYEKVIDDEMKEKYKIMPDGQELSPDEIDIAHLFLDKQDVWVINNYKYAQCSDKKNVHVMGYFTDVNSSSIKNIIMTNDSGYCEFVITKSDETSICANMDITNHKDMVKKQESDRFTPEPYITSICVNDDKTDLIISYYDYHNDRRKRDSNGNWYPIMRKLIIPFDEIK